MKLQDLVKNAQLELADAGIMFNLPQTRDVVDAVTKAIFNSVGDDGLKIPALGTFKYTTRKAYTGRHPGTGEPVQVPEKTKLTFKAKKAV